MKSSLIALATSFLLTTSLAVFAEVTSTVNLTSDYTFNGVSLTGNDPALQASLDYSGTDGFYAGTWASTVDFGNNKVELDVYAGKYFQLDEKIGLDTGIAYYTYHGDSASDTYNYPETYAKFSFDSSVGKTELNFWYTWDYFGLESGHYITMIAHTFEVASGHHLKATFDRSTSNDTNKWMWDGKKSFNHMRLEYMTHYEGFDFNLAIEDTTMNIESADSRIVLSVSRTFGL